MLILRVIVIAITSFISISATIVCTACCMASGQTDWLDEKRQINTYRVAESDTDITLIK